MTTRLTRPLAALLLLLISAFAAVEASAQGLGPTANPIVDSQREVIKGLENRTNDLEKKLQTASEDDAQLVDIRTQLETIERELIKSSVVFRPRLAEINARIEQLGPPPADGAPAEPDIVTTERQSLVAEKAEINAALGVAEDLSIRVSTLIARIADMRRDLFSRLLTKRYQFDFTFSGELSEAAQAETAELYRAVSSWLRFVVNFKLSSVLAATFFALLAAAVLLIGGRRAFGHLFDVDPDNDEPTYLSRLSVAFWSTLVPSAALGVFLGLTYFLFDYFNVLRGDIGTMLAALFGVIGLVFFVHRLGSAVLAPRLPNWRLIPVESRGATWLLWIMTATAAISGLDYFLSTVYGLLDSPLSLTLAEALLATVAIGLLVIGGGMLKPFADGEGRPRAWPGVVRYFFILLGVVTIVAALAGYIGLARFISQQVVWTGTVLATMYIGFLSSRAVSEEGAFGGTTLGRRFQRWFSLEDTALDQFGLLVSIVINILVVVAGVPLILFQWGFQPGDISAWLYKIATGIRIGSFTLSLAGLFAGIAVFVIGFVLTRWFQGWLDGSVMARGKVDTGVRNSIRTVIGYAGLALAALFAVSAAGIDLSSLALIAGGLSLGIGFGLQNVVGNFVSGLILLAERPFKAGDWIVAGAVTGTVKKISVRATEIETFQRQTVILPNSDLINSAVGNWTHRNKTGRIDIKVGIAYGADARRAFAVLTEIARGHPMVLKNPEPFVIFTNFGPTALEFEIRLFLADILNQNSVQNDIRFAILDAFAEEGIEIPSSPRYQEPPPEEKWPTDDDKAEAELIHAAHAKLEAVEAAKTATRGKQRKVRRPDPE